MTMIFATLLTIITAVSAIDCSAKELKPYNFESIKGVHSYSNLRNTPPSTTNLTWNVGICEPINNVKDCPPNSDICGITTIQLKDEKPVISEIITFNANLEKTYETSDNGVKILYKGANWGDALINAELNFVCDKDASENDFTLDQWDGTNLKLSLKNKAACITSDDDKKKEEKKKPDSGESWGWFTWIFIFLVLFLSIYIVGGAWFQYNKGNAIDFQSALKEVIENFIELLKGLPSFSKEIIEKFTGRSNRGEYSAV
ncbi:ATG27 Autophagy-related protein 27 [Candida maltosa Xu316]|uniref:Autophagy-related protein 27 n=1 Tax=Candida maltosa (strain Xu316) TaxID=1245528 RepID=M3JB99_CANMX|nr:hypothetical protein G210_5826 [Candida maltosa Xu316]